MTLPPALAKRLTAHRRLVILRCLADAPAEQRDRLLVLCLLSIMPGGYANLSLLRDLSADAGAPIVRDRVDAIGAWLAEHGLVARTADGDIVALTLTERGGDVASGRRVWPGVAPFATVDWLHKRMAAIAVAATADEIAADLGWLMGTGLLVQGELTAGMLLPTARGLDVVAGREEVEGVQKPAFGAAMRAAAAEAAAILKG